MIDTIDLLAIAAVVIYGIVLPLLSTRKKGD